jgi:hypothetical protein
MSNPLVIDENLHPNRDKSAKGLVRKARDPDAAMARWDRRNRTVAVDRDTLIEIVGIIQISERGVTDTIYLPSDLKDPSRRMGHLPTALIKIPFLRSAGYR